MFVEPDFGKSRLVDLKRSDVRGFYNYLADEKHVKVNTIEKGEQENYCVIDFSVYTQYGVLEEEVNVLQ